jgi:hypothetical protein
LATLGGFRVTAGNKQATGLPWVLRRQPGDQGQRQVCGFILGKHGVGGARRLQSAGQGAGEQRRDWGVEPSACSVALMSTATSSMGSRKRSGPGAVLDKLLAIAGQADQRMPGMLGILS